MNVLVTGGAGFIGKNLVRRLVETGRRSITVLDNLSAGQREPGVPDGVRFVRGDFTDRTTIASVIRGIDVVVHLAALSGVVDSVEDPRPSFQINVVGSFDLLQAARDAGAKRFVLASTGGALLGDVTPPISETMAPSPLSPYGASKLAMEGYCSAFAGAYGLACTVLRFSNIYGPCSAHKKSVVAAFTKAAILGEPLVVYGDGSQRRDYLFVGDLVQGIEQAIDAGVAGTFQLGSGRPGSVRDVIDAITLVAGTAVNVEYRPARAGEVHSTWCDVTKASRAFGFHAPTALANGIETTWRWFVENQGTWMHEKALSSAD